MKVLRKLFRKYIRPLSREFLNAKHQVFDKKPKLIILVYHRILPEYVYDPYNTIVSWATFQKQILYLKENYQVISLSQASEQFQKKSDMKQDQVVLTFDDGHVDNYQTVFPYLKKVKLPASFFLVTDYLNKAQRGSSQNKKYLSWEQAKEMTQSGMEIGSHGISHSSLTSLSEQKASEEIGISKEIFEKKLGVSCHHFAFPFGHFKDFSPSLILKVKKAGYRSCLLNIHGYNYQVSPPWSYKRIIMDEFRSPRVLLG